MWSVAGWPVGAGPQRMPSLTRDMSTSDRQVPRLQPVHRVGAGSAAKHREVWVQPVSGLVRKAEASCGLGEQIKRDRALPIQREPTPRQAKPPRMSAD